MLRNKSDLPFRDFKVKGGESWSDVNQRATTFFENLYKKYFKHEESKDLFVDIQQAVEVGDDYSSLIKPSTSESKQ
jgi:hypothetical protein